MQAHEAARQRRAHVCGVLALALWSSLSAMTAHVGPVPPFQLIAVTFSVGGLIGLAWHFARGGQLCALRQRPHVWAVGVGGLFGYHALYFAALSLAPPSEASLVNYLWPLLLVLGAVILPDASRPLGGAFRPRHVLGALLGLAGVAVLLSGRAESPGAAFVFGVGHLCALVGAFVWAGYSLISKRLGDVPVVFIAAVCVVTALLSGGVHLAFETTGWPESSTGWLCLAALALGPTGASFMLWDAAMKGGDQVFLGTLAFGTPVVSTALLVLAGRAEATWALAASCGLIVGGAVLAASTAPKGSALAN